MPGGCIRIPKKGNTKTLREFFRRCLVALTGGCDLQSRDELDGLSNRGWPCRTCFYDTCDRLGVPDTEAHAFWLIILRIRDDGSRGPWWRITTQKENHENSGNR